ncbi:hypothetical protein EXIGLDRAFT_587129, partial [Exidia glandulosa HHB12029]
CVLPNFAMTDYASQGKTRDVNVVDLNNLRSHQAYYTALSRSAQAAATIILQGFDRRKIQGGLSLDLKNEFRDLEILDDMTFRESSGTLPLSVVSPLRNVRIAEFLRTQDVSYVPPHMHTSLHWPKSYISELILRPSHTVYAATTAFQEQASKRKKGTKSEQPVKRRKGATIESTMNLSIPSGLKWDNQNYSCAYDVVITSLYYLWLEERTCVTSYLQRANRISALLYDNIVQYSCAQLTFERCRDNIRVALHEINPSYFPYGQSYCALADVAEILLTPVTVPNWRVCYSCSLCRKTTQIEKVPVKVLYTVSELGIQDDLCKYLSTQSRIPRCCTEYSVADLQVLEGPALLVCYIHRISINNLQNLQLVVSSCSWRLCVCVYYGGAHFTMRYVDLQNRTWYYDGMQRNGNC